MHVDPKVLTLASLPFSPHFSFLPPQCLLSTVHSVSIARDLQMDQLISALMGGEMFLNDGFMSFFGDFFCVINLVNCCPPL